MKLKLTLFTSLVCGVGFFSSAASAEEKIAAFCPYKEGQVIEPKPATDVYKTVNPKTLTKGEFETTRAYEDRVEQSRKMSRFPFPVAIEFFGYRDTVLEYDADRQVFEFNIGFAFIPHPNLEDAIRSDLGDEAPRYFHAIHAYKNGRYSTIKRIKDSKGQDFEAFRDYSQIVHIYDRSKEYRHEGLFITNGKKPNFVDIPAPISQARHLKKSLKFAAIIQPRPPYTNWFEYEENADFKDVDYDTSIHYDLDFPIIMANISCVGLCHVNCGE